MADFCPYYDEKYKQCNISGRSIDNRERENECLSSSYNWRRCPNYDKSSFETKVAKQVRTNRDL